MGSSHEQYLPDICTDIFLFTLYLRQSQSREGSEELYDRFVNLFDSMEGKAKAAGASDSDVWDVKYALAAFIDETVGWESRLELQLFGSNVAGEEFFGKLEQIKDAKGRDEVLEIYYLCLALGFEGQYVRRPEKLHSYITDFEQSVQSKRIEMLSPNGERPKEKTARQGGGIPAWIPWAFSAVGLLALGVTFILLRMGMVDWAGGVVGHIQRLFQ